MTALNTSVLITNALGMSVTRVKPLVSDEARRIFSWISYGIVCEGISLFGTVTNIINIVCFVKQGFKDSVSVSLLGLAISDLGSVVTLLFTNICLFPPFQDSDLPFDSKELQHLTTGWLHIMFTRVTSWITALITLERCLCITMPLKVKSIITPRRVTVIILFVFIIIICGNAPFYYSNRLAMKFSPEKNKTLLRLVFTDDRSIVEKVSFAINNVLIPFGAFVIVIVCTIILVVQLQKKTKWRMECTSAVKGDVTSERDQKVAKMVVMISVLFISCFIPLCITFLAMTMVPELAVDGPYINTLFILGGFSFILESTNSGVNIFIYYHMSTRYRAVFRELFARQKQKQPAD